MRKIQSVESFSNHCSKSYITTTRGVFSKQIKSIGQKMDDKLCRVPTILADITFSYCCQCKAYHLLSSLIVWAGSWKWAHFCWHCVCACLPFVMIQYETLAQTLCNFCEKRVPQSARFLFDPPQNHSCSTIAFWWCLSRVV